MDQTSSLMFGMLFGAIGAGFIVYGRKQRQGIALLCGIVLCVCPYFIDSLFMLLSVGAALMAVPFVIKL